MVGEERKAMGTWIPVVPCSKPGFSRGLRRRVVVARQWSLRFLPTLGRS